MERWILKGGPRNGETTKKSANAPARRVLRTHSSASTTVRRMKYVIRR
jgi:hypothetical protein